MKSHKVGVALLLIQPTLSRWASLTFLTAALVVIATQYVEVGQGSPGPGAGAQSEESEVEKGREIFGQVCVNCHGLSKTAMLQKTSEGWRRTVYSMISRDAQLMPDEIEPLILYLTAAYGPDSAPPSLGDDASQNQALPEGPGRAILARSCFQCHAVDLVVNSRKSETEWKETISRMVSTGANVTPQEQNVLVQYTAKHFGTE